MLSLLRIASRSTPSATKAPSIDSVVVVEDFVVVAIVVVVVNFVVVVVWRVVMEVVLGVDVGVVVVVVVVVVVGFVSILRGSIRLRIQGTNVDTLV